jgi:hypothetical protein
MAHEVITLLAQRRQLLRAALQPHIDGGRLPAPLMDYIDTLYARRRDFEAERIAGLALWLGTDSSATWRETCFEGFGVMLRATDTVLQGVAALSMHEGTGEPCVTREQRLCACGLSPACATRWSQLGQRRLSFTSATLPERGRRVQDLVQWLAGTSTLAESGRAQSPTNIEIVTSLEVVEQAAEEALHAIQTVSRCVWHVWVQRSWRAVAPRCADFLDRELGVGPTLGAALIALGQDSALWPVLPQPLSCLEVVVTILARATAGAADTRGEERRGPYA